MILGIIQARMKSTRLPGKVAMSMGGIPMLGHVILAAMACRMIDRVIVITSEDPDDVAVVQIGSHYTQVIRTNKILSDGTNDVLHWFARASSAYMAMDTIVRITGDCPLWCPVLGAEVIAAHLARRCDYTSNVSKEIDGFDTEVFTSDALRNADRLATTCYDRHHVTPYMRLNFSQHWVDHRPLVGHAKLSVDTLEDFNRCNALMRPHSRPLAYYETMCAFAEKGFSLCSDMPSPSPTKNEPSR